MNKGFSIAIDGPVASGKGTLASNLAKILNGQFINTGGMYRACALYCIENDIDTSKEAEVVEILPSIKVDLDGENVYLNGKDVSERLKEPDVSEISSILASYTDIRHDLAKRQHEIAQRLIDQGKAVIVEGRDIGIRVLPNADLKIFLTADPETRAERRRNQYEEKGINMTFEEVLSETNSRDDLDSSRETDPLPSDPKSLGYWLLDDSGQSEEETIQTVLKELKFRGLLND